MDNINSIKQLFENYGNVTYGEKMTILSHSVQSALIAKSRELNDNLVVAAFLHDVGHMLPLTNETDESMGGFGAIDHETSGAKYLIDVGFNAYITEPIKNHVMSKRYLCTVNDQYHSELSDASKKTMEYQGGLLNEDEVAAFEKEPYFLESVELRLIDDEAKEEDFEVNSVVVEDLFQLCSEVLKNQKVSI
jgi:2-amino-1-hydroxyethylphosphonate dioxygenase (glycine-forming)